MTPTEIMSEPTKLEQARAMAADQAKLKALREWEREKSAEDARAKAEQVAAAKAQAEAEEAQAEAVYNEVFSATYDEEMRRLREAKPATPTPQEPPARQPAMTPRDIAKRFKHALKHGVPEDFCADSRE